MSFAVVNEAFPGTTLVVQMNGVRPDNWLHQPGVSVTPSVVEKAIRSALSQGWRAADGGAPYVLVLPEV